MENTVDIELDYRKWLVFSNVVKSAAATSEFEKALKQKKSTKNITITVEQNAGEKLYFIKEANNSSILRIDEVDIDEIKKYVEREYKQAKPENGKLKNPYTKSKQWSSRFDSKNTPSKYLYSENKIKHGLIYSLYTLLSLQLLILPHLVLNVEIGIIGLLLRYPISLIGLFFCFKYYKQSYEYHLNFHDVYLIVWNFSAFLFFFYLSEVTVLSIPDQVPNVTWTSFVFIGTLILGLVYLLISSLVLALIFNLVKRII
ncbi:MAG: hypothetical protein RJQ14_17650 [Marinoscillum sp.]